MIHKSLRFSLKPLNVNLVNQSCYGVLSHSKLMEKCKNYGKVRTFLQEFKEILYQGSIDQYNDAKKMLNNISIPQKTAVNLHEIALTQKNLFKFIPFSFFLVVPFTEFLLPPYLFFFPNSLPTTYIFDNQLTKIELKKDRKQMNSQRFLFQSLKSRFPELKDLHDSPNYTPEVLQKFVLDNHKILQGQLNLDQLNSEQLVHVCKFYGMEFVRGTYIISKTFKVIVNLPIHLQNLYYFIIKSPKRKVIKNILQNWNIQLMFPLEDLKRHLLLYQIRKHFNKIHNEDKAFLQYGKEGLTLELLKNFTRERGFPGIQVERNEDEKLDLEMYSILKQTTIKRAYSRFEKDWLQYAEQGQVFNSMKLWYAILYYERYHSNILNDYQKRVEALLH